MKKPMVLWVKAIGIFVSLALLAVGFGSIDQSAPDLSTHQRLACPPKTVPDKQNGLHWLIQAAAKWRPMTDYSTEHGINVWVHGGTLYQPAIEEAHAYELIAGYLKENQAAIADVDQALACDHWIWPAPDDLPKRDLMDLIKAKISWMQSFKHGLQALSWQAASQRRAGDLDGAIATLAKRCRFYNLGMHDYQSELIAFMLQVAHCHETVFMAETLINDPRLNERQAAGLLRLCNELADSSDALKNHFSQDLALQPVFCSRKALRNWISDSPNLPIESRCLAKFLVTCPYTYHPNQLVATRLRICEEAMAQIGKTDAEIRVWQRVDSSRKPNGLDFFWQVLPNHAGRVLESDGFLFSPQRLRYNYGKIIHKAIEGETLISGVRLQAASRLYELRHGQLPDRLDQLVPEYLPAIPRDPYDGKPFRYVRDQQILYSIGANPQDDSGTPPPFGGNRRYAMAEGAINTGGDIVFPLKKIQEMPVKVLEPEKTPANIDISKDLQKLLQP